MGEFVDKILNTGTNLSYCHASVKRLYAFVNEQSLRFLRSRHITGCVGGSKTQPICYIIWSQPQLYAQVASVGVYYSSLYACGRSQSCHFYLVPGVKCVVTVGLRDPVLLLANTTGYSNFDKVTN